MFNKTNISKLSNPISTGQKLWILTGISILGWAVYDLLIKRSYGQSKSLTSSGLPDLVETMSSQTGTVGGTTNAAVTITNSIPTTGLATDATLQLINQKLTPLTIGAKPDDVKTYINTTQLIDTTDALKVIFENVGGKDATVKHGGEPYIMTADTQRFFEREVDYSSRKYSVFAPIEVDATNTSVRVTKILLQ